MMKEIRSNAEIKNRIAEGMSGASCGSNVVYDCVDAPAEGMKNYTHPKQGSAKDCSIIAALSSIAAVAPARMQGVYPNYTFLSKTITLPNKKLAVDASGNLVYASSNGGSWPMLWEKAYAMLISTATITTRSCVSFPDIGKAFENGYAGLTALKEIGRYQTAVQGSILYDGASGKLLWPAIGTTNSTLVENDFWKRDHDYSVIKYDTVNKKYLIRNPCGGVEQWVGDDEFKPGSQHFKLWGYVKDPKS
jgi:hypothetical protein